MREEINMSKDVVDLDRVATTLAAASRLVRKAADEHDLVLQKLRDVSAHATAEAAAADAAARAERLKDIEPYIRAGEALVAESKAARAAAQAVVDRYAGIDWPSVLKVYATKNISGEHSTGTRISALRSAVTELRDWLATSSDQELIDAVAVARALGDVVRQEEHYVVNSLKHVTRLTTGSADTMRRRTETIHHMAADLGQIFNQEAN